MMSVLLRRGIASLLFRNSSFLCNYNACFWLSFSTRIETQHAETLNVYLDNYHFSPGVVSRAASVLSGRKNLERSETVLSFLKQSGFTNSQWETMVRIRPNLLTTNVEKVIKPKLKIFHDLSFNADDIAKINSSNTLILFRSTSNKIIPTVSLSKGLVGSNALVTKLSSRCSWFLTVNVNTTMLPNIECLKSCGVPMKQITTYIKCFPRFTLVKPEIVRKSVEKVDKMGFHRSSPSYIAAVGVLSSRSQALGRQVKRLYAILVSQRMRSWICFGQHL